MHRRCQNQPNPRLIKPETTCGVGPLPTPSSIDWKLVHAQAVRDGGESVKNPLAPSLACTGSGFQPFELSVVKAWKPGLPVPGKPDLQVSSGVLVRPVLWKTFGSQFYLVRVNLTSIAFAADVSQLNELEASGATHKEVGAWVNPLQSPSRGLLCW